jgi:hypothetical protein
MQTIYRTYLEKIIVLDVPSCSERQVFPNLKRHYYNIYNDYRSLLYLMVVDYFCNSED